MFFPAEIIKKKRNNQPLSRSEIEFFVNGYTDGSIPDYQMSALLMAIYFQGMDKEETLSLTHCMINSGRTLDFSYIPRAKVDKHSTGGVGDKTSLILGPIVAACGIAVPMISGRGLGHTGGTLDKLESIPGFNTQLTLEQFQKAIENQNIGFIGQTLQICPADKKIYALRDVTATVESFPLICASIMSKKLAEGIDALVLDVKFGSGAFMKTPEQAEQLAKKLMEIAQGYGKKVTSILTSMNQPLGRFAGNALEVFECVEIMKNKTHINSDGYDSYADTRELSLVLSAHMILLAGREQDEKKAYALAEEALLSGRAFEKFKQLCNLHSARLEELPQASRHFVVKATQSGFIQAMNTEKIGLATIAIQAGRLKTSDQIDPVTGIEFHKKIGDPIQKDEALFTIHGSSKTSFEDSAKILTSSVTISLQKPPRDSLILKFLL